MINGRPRGASHRIRTAPVPTMHDENLHRGIVGTGVGWTWRGVPRGRPSSLFS